MRHIIIKYITVYKKIYTISSVFIGAGNIKYLKSVALHKIVMHKNMNINKFADGVLLNEEIMDSFILLSDIYTDEMNIISNDIIKEDNKKVGNPNELLNPIMSNDKLQNDDFNDKDMLQTVNSSKLKNGNKINIIPNDINDGLLINEETKDNEDNEETKDNEDNEDNAKREEYTENNNFDNLFGYITPNNELQNDNFNNEDLLQKLSSNNLINNKSYNTLSKTGIKNKISKWKEDIKNSILEDVIYTNKIKRKIPDNTTKYTELDDFYIVDGVFIIKEGKKWLNLETQSNGMVQGGGIFGVEMFQQWDVTHKHGSRFNEESYMLNFQNNQHMYYFKDLDDIQNEKSYKEQYEQMIKERETLRTATDVELLTRVIENKQYMDYLENTIEINDSNLLEDKLREKMEEKIVGRIGTITYELQNSVQILQNIQTHKENIKKNPTQEKGIIKKNRSDIIRKVINYINEKKIKI